MTRRFFLPFRERIAYDLVNEPLELQVKEGQLPVPDGPGLGVTLNEAIGRALSASADRVTGVPVSLPIFTQ